jgi:hypothetical protein
MRLRCLISGLISCLSLVLPVLVYAISLQVGWDYTDSGQSGFELLRCVDSGGGCTPSVALGISIGPSLRQATDTTPSGGTNYCYTVRAIQTSGSPSNASNLICVSVPVSGTATHLVFNPGPPPSTLTNAAISTVLVEARDGFEVVVTSATPSVTVALVPAAQAALPQQTLSLVSVDSQETIFENAPGAKAIDGSTSTWWITQYGDGSSPAALPHTLTLDLGATYNVTAFTYLPRQDGGSTTRNGTIAGYQFDVSLDNILWGSHAATGIFADTVAAKTVQFMGRSGRYVRLIGTSETHGGPWTSVAELTVLQTANGTGTLQGTATHNAVSGVATFTGLSVTLAGTYVLQATASGLTAANTPFTIVDSPIPLDVPYVVRSNAP